MQNKYQWLFESAKKLNGTQIDFKYEWQAHRFLLDNKMFAYLGHDNNGHEILTLKGDPAYNRLLQEMYENITAGYYMNKLHWISIYLQSDTQLDKSHIMDLLTKAYQSIYDKLSKKKQGLL